MIKRIWQHIPIGAGIGWMIYHHLPIGVSLFSGFIAYECIQDWKLRKSKSYPDVLGALIGLGTIGALLITEICPVIIL